jgi:hypothetical protein
MKIRRFIRKIFAHLIYAKNDIYFMIFMAIQEIDDISYLVAFENKAVYTVDTLVLA